MASSDNISSRLLTMKFMQRGILNSPTASPSHQRGGSSKRQRLSSDGTFKSRKSDADMEAAMQSAIADEEARRQEVMERVAAEKGDTRWVLSVQQPLRQSKQKGGGVVYNVAVAGFADIDEGDGTGSESGEEDDEDGDADAQRGSGRRTYGQVNVNSKAEADDIESDDDGSEEEYDPSSIDAMIAEAQTAAARGSKTSSAANGDRMPTSISGGGGSLSNRSTPRKSFNCYKCGEEGHIAKLCPNR